MQPKGRLLLVRHGQTAANVDQVWHGHTDTALTDLGLEQANRLGDYFHNYLPDIHAIYSSPLQRAKYTAEQIARGGDHEVKFDPRLMEFGAGDFEGKSFDELKGEHGFIKKVINDEHHRPPGGETRAEVTERFVGAVDGFLAKHPGENLVVVAHGLAIAFALSHWIDQDRSKWVNYQISNTSVTEICTVNAEIKFFDQTDHL